MAEEFQGLRALAVEPCKPKDGNAEPAFSQEDIARMKRLMGQPSTGPSLYQMTEDDLFDVYGISIHPLSGAVVYPEENQE